MAFKRRRGGYTGVALAMALAGCGTMPRFRLREPLEQDTDQKPISVACQTRPSPKDPKHVSCAPEPYVSPLAWDGIDNSIFRPLARVFAVDPGGEAQNVNALDEVPDSAWFTNRIGVKKLSREELQRGACNDEDRLEGETAARGSWLVDHGKDAGATPGFRILVDGKRKYLLKADEPSEPERPSAASAIGAAIYHAVGYYTTCEQVVYFSPAALRLKSGLTVTNNTGVTHRFDAKALASMLEKATHRGGLVRMQASRWLPGYLLGPFRYEGTRSDDPNDVVRHEDRRDLRGARVLAAWLNHFDAREENSMDSWIAADGTSSDSSPGYVRHYYLDTSDVFGSEWNWDPISRRLGHSYLLDFGDIGADFLTLGALERPWDRAERSPGFEQFGYFSARDFAPDAWKNEYPNPAFSRATELDNAWMARILAHFERKDIDALVALGRFSDPKQAAFLSEVLEQRLRRILERYLLRLSPLARVRVERGDTLCATDLARLRAVKLDSAFHYAAQLARASGRAALAPSVRSSGELCLRLPHSAPDAGPADDDAARYVVLTIANGASQYPLRVFLYDLGPRRGYRLVGLERPQTTRATPPP